jgi:exodeoxyribonuclease III
MKSHKPHRLRRVCALAMFLSTLLTASAVHGQDSLKVASYNILVGGTGAGQPLSRTAAVIQASGADIVGIQEALGSTAQIAAMLGWNFRVLSADYGSETGNVDNAILSRFPITQTLRSGVRVEIAPGKEAYVFDTHLAAYPYQPYDLRDRLITTEAQAISGANNARGAQINLVLAEAAPYVSAGRAVFLTGDMNEPSHLDWTAAAATARIHQIKVAWPASLSTVNAGFRDSYREIHPDEVALPGNTWTPMPGSGEVHDRIDFVYSSGAGLTTTNSQIVGESTARANIVVLPYPSDHRAVVSTFSVAPEALARLRTGVNLISNGGAEGNPGTSSLFDRVITDWETSTTNTAATSQLYNKPPFAPAIAGGGANYFHGGNMFATAAESHSIGQKISLSDLTAGIDLGLARYDLSGYFGGATNQSDTASLTATFLDALGASLGRVTIGNVTAAERQNITRLLQRSTSGEVPMFTRDIDLTLTFTKGTENGVNDGSADNLSLVINMVPEPSAICLVLLPLVLGCGRQRAGFAFARY